MNLGKLLLEGTVLALEMVATIVGAGFAIHWML